MTDKNHDFSETLKKNAEKKKQEAAERAKKNKGVVRSHNLKK